MQKEKFSLILDIRSGTVGVVATRGLTVLFSRRAQVPIQETFDAARAVGPITESLRTLLAELAHACPGHPAQIIVVMGTPWFASQSRTVTYKNATPIEITAGFLEKLIKEETHAFIDDHFKNSSYEVIEQVTLRTLLNGYETSKPLKKDASEVEISYYFSVAEQSFVETIRAEIGKHYHASEHDIKFHTFAYASLRAAEETKLREIQSFVFADIGGEVSELSLIDGRHLAESISFPMGAHTIVRDMAKAFSSNLSESRSLYDAYREGRVTPSVREKIEQVLSGVSLKWATYLHAILEKLSHTHLVPTLYVVVGTQEASDLFCKSLHEKEVLGLAGGAAGPTCLMLSGDDLWLVGSDAKVGKPDVFLALDAIFVDKTYQLT